MTDADEWDGIPDFLKVVDKPCPPDRVPGPRYSDNELRAIDDSEYPKMWRRDGNGWIFEGVLHAWCIKLVAVRGNKFRLRMPSSSHPYANLVGGSLHVWSMTIDGPINDVDLIDATKAAINAAEGMFELWSGRN